VIRVSTLSLGDAELRSARSRAWQKGSRASNRGAERGATATIEFALHLEGRTGERLYETGD